MPAYHFNIKLKKLIDGTKVEYEMTALIIASNKKKAINVFKKLFSEEFDESLTPSDEKKIKEYLVNKKRGIDAYILHSSMVM